MVTLFSITAFAASKLVKDEAVSSPSVKARILKRHYGYLFLKATNWLTACIIESYNLVDPLGLAPAISLLKSYMASKGLSTKRANLNIICEGQTQIISLL